ncbi:MAG: histone deacetylase [Anaerolineae bacterium]|nr:histone deacetylase [Anaerolineae bacterium]
MKVFYSDQFPFPLPHGHMFPLRKFRLLREAVQRSGAIPPEDLRVPPAATDAQILRAHTADYLERLKTGQLTPKEVRRIGLPWSAELVERVRYSTGGTIAACRAALSDGIAANLSGGTHHGFADHGQGYCLFNDIVIAARAMQDEGRARRVVVIDCDAHQGNGTAALAAGDPTLFTFSIHNRQNFPLRKVPSDLDVGLDDGTGDAAYLSALEDGLRRALERAQADLAIYLAGADPYERDLLGRLALTQAGLAARDRLVFSHCRQASLPVAVTIAGGYGQRLQETVEIHLQTICIAGEYAALWQAS